MTSGKQTPAPKASSERKSPAEKAIQAIEGKDSKKEQNPKPSQKN